VNSLKKNQIKLNFSKFKI